MKINITQSVVVSSSLEPSSDWDSLSDWDSDSDFSDSLSDPDSDSDSLADPEALTCIRAFDDYWAAEIAGAISWDKLAVCLSSAVKPSASGFTFLFAAFGGLAEATRSAATAALASAFFTAAASFSFFSSWSSSSASSFFYSAATFLSNSVTGFSSFALLSRYSLAIFSWLVLISFSFSSAVFTFGY